MKMSEEERAYKVWIQSQRSCISGHFSVYINGEGRCIAAHCRRIKWGAGTGIKPTFCYVPLTHKEHELQHQKGESYFNPSEWWEQKVEYYQQLYNISRNKIILEDF